MLLHRYPVSLKQELIDQSYLERQKDKQSFYLSLTLTITYVFSIDQQIVMNYISIGKIEHKTLSNEDTTYSNLTILMLSSPL